MRVKNYFCLLLVSVFLMTGFTACNDDSPSELYLGISTVYLKYGEDATLYIYSGNGGYVLTVDNENLVTATEKNNIITLTPHYTGKTTLRIKDIENKEASVVLNIVQPYLAFGVNQREIIVSADDSQVSKTIQTELEENSSLLKAHIYDLSRNDGKTYTLYKENWFSTSVSTGYYEFGVGSDDTQTLTLKQGSEEHTYTLEKNNNVAKVFYDYFNESKKGEYSETTFTLTEDLTAAYAAEYPSAGIKEVKLVGTVTLLEYRFN